MLPVKANREHPYLNFHGWSVDGSDSMRINKQPFWNIYTIYIIAMQPKPIFHPL